MNDRLIMKSEDKFVKGHVIGFYGPKLGLKSPRGFPVQEEAIVFIRTGQRIVRAGDQFDFDPTRFPTPWPPVKTPTSKDLNQ